MRRCNFFWLMVVLLIQPISGYALSLGSIQLYSRLNEPLNAIIPLKGMQADQIDSLKVRLASKEHFTKLGLDRPYLLQQLRFSTESLSRTEHQIHITTHNGLRELTLNFLLEITLGNKRLIKEYILLLDPPEHQTAAVPAMPASATANTAGRPLPASAANTYGPVKYSDTLSGIATRIRPAPHLNIYQIMVALLRANPHAFVRNNINNLREGAVLKIPEIDAIGKISKRQARRSFMNHASKIELASPSKAHDKPQEQPGHKLPPTPQVTVETPVSPSEQSNALRLEELRQQTMRLMRQQPAPAVQQPPAGIGEAESKLKRLLTNYSELEGVLEEHKQVIQLLEAQSGEENSTVDSLVTTADQLRGNIAARIHEIAQLQAFIKDRETTSRTQPTVKRVPTPQDEAAQEKLLLTKKLTTKPAPVQQNETAQEKPLLAKKLTPKPAPVQQSETTQEKSLLLWLILLLVAISGLATWLLKQREHSKRQPGNDFQHPGEKSEVKAVKPKQGAPIAKRAPASAVTKLIVAEKSSAPPSHKPPRQHNNSEVPKDIKLIYKELDIYLSYRDFSKAEQLLNATLLTDPDNMLLKVKRLDIYAFRNEKEPFFRYLNTLKSELDERAPEYWKHVIGLIRRFAPDHALVTEKAMTLDEIEPTKSVK